MSESVELGLFPLEMVMLPGEAVPLHLFEPRYRELFADAVLEAQPFVILLSSDGERAGVGCAGQTEVMSKRLADGRLNVVVRGSHPVRITDEPTVGGSLYETALVEPLEDEDEEVPADLRTRATTLFAELAGADQAPELPDGVPLSYALAGVIEMPTAPKQSLLETRRESTRLEAVIELLENADRAAGHVRTAADRAQRNGKVTTPS